MFLVIFFTRNKCLWLIAGAIYIRLVQTKIQCICRIHVKTPQLFPKTPPIFFQNKNYFTKMPPIFFLLKRWYHVWCLVIQDLSSKFLYYIYSAPSVYRPPFYRQPRLSPKFSSVPISPIKNTPLYCQTQLPPSATGFQTQKS